MNAGSDRHFVAKYQRAIDEADLLEAHGSGRYLLMLNDARARKTIDRATVTVYNDQAPPRVRPEPIIAVPENEPWRHWVEEVQAAKAKTAATAQPPVAVEVKPAPPAEATAREAIHEFAELSKKLLERRESDAVGQVQNDLERIAALVQSLKALLPPAPPPSEANTGAQLERPSPAPHLDKLCPSVRDGRHTAGSFAGQAQHGQAPADSRGRRRFEPDPATTAAGGHSPAGGGAAYGALFLCFAPPAYRTLRSPGRCTSPASPPGPPAAAPPPIATPSRPRFIHGLLALSSHAARLSGDSSW